MRHIPTAAGLRRTAFFSVTTHWNRLWKRATHPEPPSSAAVSWKTRRFSLLAKISRRASCPALRSVTFSDSMLFRAVWSPATVFMAAASVLVRGSLPVRGVRGGGSCRAVAGALLSRRKKVDAGGDNPIPPRTPPR